MTRLSDLRVFTGEYHDHPLGNGEPVYEEATVSDLVAALQEEGVGEVVEAETCAERHVGCTTLEVFGLLPGRYLVVRIEGET